MLQVLTVRTGSSLFNQVMQYGFTSDRIKQSETSRHAKNKQFKMEKTEKLKDCDWISRAVLPVAFVTRPKTKGPLHPPLTQDPCRDSCLN